jgi:cytoskeletal protein RodZ
MAIYTDPQTGERREVDDLVRPTNYGSSWGVIAILIIAAALAAWYFYGRATPTLDNTHTSATTQSAPEPYPVNPTPPSPSATTPAPSTTPAAPSDNSPGAPKTP